MKKISQLLVASSTFMPFVAFAASSKTLHDLVGTAAIYINDALDLLMGLAVVMFVWYVIQYFMRPSEKGRSEGGQYVMWSVIGFFVIFSLWGNVNILMSTFDLGENSAGTWTSFSNIFPQ